MNTPNQKPGLVTAIAVMTLTSGIVNLFWGFIAALSVLHTIVGIICIPIVILPTVLGIFEIIYAAKLLSAQPQPVQPSQPIAILEILCVLFGNVFAMTVGILSLVFYNDLVVKNYFAQLNGTAVTPPTAPIPTLPVEPASQTDPESAPSETEPSQPGDIPEEPKNTGKPAG